MPKLSIIIPAKNEERQLPSLFDSLDAQTFRDFEVIVADAQSQDKTRKLAAEHGAHVVEGGLPAFGRNAGAREAQGELLMFLDADVAFGPEFLESAVHEFESRQLAAATVPMDPDSDLLIDKVLHGFVNVFIALMAYVDPHSGGMCIMVRKRTHELVGGFDTKLILGEDHDYVRRISRMGHGPFRMLRSIRVLISVRRLTAEGRLSLAFKYLIYELIQKFPKRWQRDPWDYMHHLGGPSRPSTGAQTRPEQSRRTVHDGSSRAKPKGGDV